MSMTLTESRDLMKELQKAAIRHLEDRGFSREQIGRMLGYAGRSMVNAVMSDSQYLFGLPQTLILSRICSESGCDVLADAFSSDDKIAVPIRWHVDGDLTDEVHEIVQGMGIGSTAFDSGDGRRAIAESERVVRGALGFRTEALHRFAPVVGNHLCGELFR